MRRYREIRDQLVEQLLNDALAHEVGRFEDIGSGFDDIEAALADNQTAEFHRLRVVKEFWDGWIDARNHDWRFYEPLARDDWPVLAREVAADLQADRDIENPKVLAMMQDPPPLRNHLRDWLMRLFHRSSDHPA
jgi:hypothetical protein